MSKFYNTVYEKIAESQTLQAIWRKAYGPDYLEGAFYSAITKSELEYVSSWLELTAGHTLVDVGCGMGAAGIEIAKQTGCSLIGIDTSDVAIQIAQTRARGIRAEYKVADIANTSLPTHSADAVICIDVLQMLPNLVDSLTEIKRILKPGYPCAFTAWEIPHLKPDYRPVLESAGFTILAYNEPLNWREPQALVFQQILNQATVLAEELGEVCASFLSEAHAVLATIDQLRRIIAVVK
ncbi:MAG: class I SAM-dependent methyltransferase [Acidobacteria bacterium]|nr:class I SAM-dependent methyltransferase [Acidobacteriota bacterium]